MAEEQLTLVDGMSPSLRRIYQEAEKLNRRMLTLRSNIKTLEKPTSMSYLRRELKSVETQAKATERALKAMKAAEVNNARYGAFKVGANGRYYLNGMQVRNADRLAMAEAYNRNIQNAQLRRNRLLWDTGRRVNGLTFDERYNAWMSKKSAVLTPIKSFSNNSSLSTSVLGVIGAITTFTIAIQGATDAVKSFINLQDEYVGGITRVALTSDKTYTPTEMMDRLYDTSIRTRADSEGTISLYNRIAMSGVKASNDRILRFVETFNKTMAISGTSAQENRAVMLQLAQGMGSNRLGGDEFRSIAEQAPMFKYMLARGMGVNPGALKQMGAEGKLTAEAIMTAMEKVQDQIDDIFRTAPWTIGQLLTILQDKWQKLITHQMTGYIELRNLIRDFVSWLDTTDGTKFMNELIGSINMVIHVFVSLIKLLTPAFKWVATHLKFLTKLTLVFINLWSASRWFAIAGGIINSFKLITMSGTTMWTALSAGATSFGAVCAAVLGWISLIIGAMVLAWNVGQKIADHIQEKRELEAVGVNEQQLNYNKNQMWEKYAKQRIKEQGLTLTESQVGGGFGTKEQSVWNKSRQNNPEYQKWEKEIWKPIEDDVRKHNDEWQRQNNLGKYKKTEEQKLQDELNNMTKSFEGAMDSSKNIPMDVKGGKLDSVGRINEDVSLNTDSIQMLKAIAERSWIMQNEVTVPQAVSISIDKSVNVEPETIAEMLNEGTQIATASSMRGVMVA